MTRLAAISEAHWKEHLPKAYANIKNKTAFFASLAEDAQAQIEDLAEALRGSDLQGEPFASKVGRYAMARSNAEAVIMREVLLLPAEADDPAEGLPEGGDELRQAIAAFDAAREEFNLLRD